MSEIPCISHSDSSVAFEQAWPTIGATRVTGLAIFGFPAVRHLRPSNLTKLKS